MNNDEEAFAITQQFYDDHAIAYSDNTVEMADVEWRNRFLERIPKRGMILDVGCASGRDTSWFAGQDRRAVGIDLSPEMIGLAREKYPNLEFKVMNVVNMDFSDDLFDGVWCSCVLLHVPRHLLQRSVSELVRVLKPGGVAYVLVKEGRWEGLENDERYGGARKFASYFEPAEIRMAFENAHCRVVDSDDMHEKVDEYRASNRVFAMAQKLT